MKQLFFILCVLFALNSAGQTIKFRFDGTLTNIDAGKKEGGVSVSIVQNGSTLYNTTTSSNGKYVLSGDVDYSKPFDVVFSKSGFVSKRVNFNFAGLNEEDTPSGSEYKPVSDLSIDIFGVRPNVDFSFLDTQPVASFSWNKSKFAADPDQSQIAKMRTKIDKLLLEAEKNAANAEANYNAAIAEADKLYTAKNYEGALAKYEEALAIKPKEKHPADRILELDALIQKKKEAELAEKQENAEYYNLIQAADNFRNAKDFEKAKAKYQEALAKKDEQYPKDEIKKIDAAIKEKENEEAYKAAIELGDMMLKQKSYKAARDKYTEASKLKPSEQYPKTKLAELDAMIKQQEDVLANKKKYEDAVAAGDKLFTEEKWEESKAKYKEALAIESASTYVSGRIKLIDETLEKLKAEKEKEAQITKLLGEGAAAQLAKKYTESLAKYKEVLTLDDKNAVALPKIAELEKLIADAEQAAAKDAEFLALVKKGDDAVVGKKLEVAVTNYEAALAIKTDPAVQTKLSDVQKQLADLKNAEQLNADYTKLMTEGKTAFDAKSYEDALAKYESAKALKPTEAAPQAKIDEIKLILVKLADENKKNENIAKLLAEGESLMSSSSWEEAKMKYNEVLTLAPANETAKAKIKEIDAALALEKEKADKDAKFAEYVSKGDADATADKGELAIANYKLALKIREDAGVQQKIDAIQMKLDQAAANKELDGKYTAAITEGDKLLGEKKYGLAKDKYAIAAGLKPTETYPTTKISEIDVLLAKELADKEKADQIKQFLAEGSTLLTAKDYEGAKTKYEGVLAIDNANATAQTKLNEINTALANMMDQAAKDKEFNALKSEGLSLMSQNQLNPAKTKLTAALQIKDDSEVKAKIAEIDATLKAQADKATKITNLLAEGQKLFDDKKLKDAKSKYEAVLALDAANSEAQNKIGAIDEALAQQMNADQQKAEFEKLKKEGFDLAKAQNYDGAVTKLQAALAIQADPTVQAKLDEVKGIISANQDKTARIAGLLENGQQLFNDTKFDQAKIKYNEVLTLDPTNSEAKLKLAQIDTELAKLSSQNQQKAEFEKLKKEGFDLASAKKWNDAKTKLEQALIIQDDSSVRQKIAEIDAAIAMAGESQQKEQQYQELVSAGQSAIDSKNYEEALSKFKEAAIVKPSEQLPKTKIAEINDLIKNSAKNAELDAKYLALIEQGDQLVENKDYVTAISKYNDALALKPTEVLPVEKAKRAQALADEMSRNQNDVQYEKILSTISQKIETKEYDRAKELIDRALTLRPDDNRPKALLKEIQDQEKRLADFKNLMSQGQKEGAAKNYDKAINSYEQAKALMPSNTEPDDRIAALREEMNSQNKNDEQEQLFNNYVSNGDESAANENYDIALNNYQNALSLKPGHAPTIAKVKEIERKLDEIANNKAQSAELQNKFNAIVKEADDFFNSESYPEAIDRYKSALELIPTSTYAQRQLVEAQNRSSKMAIAEVEKEYKKILSTADRYLRETNYTKATELYKRALTLKSGDPYPKKKLAEIDAILNPVSEVGPELLPLGEEYDNSIMDGSTALALAEEQRRNLKGRKMKNRLDGIGDAESAMTTKKSEDNLASTNEIYSIYRNVAIDSEERDLNRLELVEALRTEEEVRSLKLDADNYYEHASTIGTQSYLTEVEKEGAIDYGIRSSVYTQNSADLGAIQISADDEAKLLAGNYYIENINTDGRLNEITSQYNGDYIENQDKRIAEGQKVEVVRINAENQTKEIDVLNYDENLATKESLNQVVANTEVSTTESVKKQEENHLKLEVVSQDAAVKMNDNSKIQQERVVSTDQKFIDVKKSLAIDGESRGENQLENVAYVDQIDKKATISNNEFNYSDEQQRLGSQAKMDYVNSSQTTRATEEVEKLKGNSTSMDDLSKSIEAEKANTGYDQKEKILETKKQVEQVNDDPKDKPIIANSLGEEYPEGVSQEVFQRKDENGIMNAIITRRVVVFEGKGDVYVKTQSLNATTYSKNGKPTTEYVWQKETQASHLERHF